VYALDVSGDYTGHVSNAQFFCHFQRLVLNLGVVSTHPTSHFEMCGSQGIKQESLGSSLVGLGTQVLKDHSMISISALRSAC
jgi:hypothetical protein